MRMSTPSLLVLLLGIPACGKSTTADELRRVFAERGMAATVLCVDEEVRKRRLAEGLAEGHMDSATATCACAVCPPQGWE